MLQVRDAHARAAAVEALGKMRAVAAQPEIAAVAMSDPEWWVRTWAAAALGKIGAKNASEQLIRLLSDPDFRIRRAALVGLDNLGDKSTLDAIRNAKRREPWYRRSSYRRTLKRIRAKTGIG